MLDVIRRPASLGALARRVAQGTLPPEWGIATPQNVEQWMSRARSTASLANDDWLAPLSDALDLNSAAGERLKRVVRSGGVVVTTGQQPGLFGGPLYTWFKGLTALALADAIERVTGIPAAPIFWAATDDSDIAEAAWTAIATRGGATLLRMHAEAPDGAPMSLAPLGDISGGMAQLRQVATPIVYPDFLDFATTAYSPSSTVGAAYVRLLRSVMEPMEIAVLDAGHVAVRRRADKVLRSALKSAAAVERAVAQRNVELRSMGMEPQVHEVSGLSLVFLHENGVRRRIPLEESESAARVAQPGVLSPNVLLRPVVERAILPTVGYVGGPAELSYFAQSAAVSAALEVVTPVAVPRLSATLMEEHIRRILNQYDLEASDLASPHEAWNRLARNGVPADVLASISELKRATDATFDRALAATSAGSDPLFDGPEVINGSRATVHHRIARFERRLIAAAKRRDVRLAEDFATARGALYPLGRPQERALNIIPFLSRHGDDVLQAIRAAADEHASEIVSGEMRDHGAAAAQVSAVSASD